MPFIVGCVLPVDGARRDRFTEQARKAGSFFREFGATDIVDALGDDVPEGKITDFQRSVATTEGELVGFGWIEWPDKASRDAAETQMMSDPRMDMSDMAFDGKRMIFGGFEPVVDEGPRTPSAYVDGFVLAVPTASRDAFVKHCQLAAPIFLRNGATRVVECWGVDVRAGKVTDFQRAVQATPEETVCFSWIEWPDRATRDAGHKAVSVEMEQKPDDNPMPFDGKRVVFGGFELVSRA